ncbi:cytochrome c peroxidase [Amphritea sp. 1_MG-2023]|uniref:cytochrome-c peroxidase n=1 Tax=Amphritea sp. 1_MG-2023 TaxID=3062670 RepID=UPI0026E16B61|nr:cytochrome c peroxidase [Amphritea sp. 1_MG-2023]MDO6564147.1 cytochrome c peroxidase [Amphritea sp. 1_MG-2023]
MQALLQYNWASVTRLTLIISLATTLLPALVSATDLSSEPITPIASISNLNQAKVQLGKALFHDPRLSSNNSISCASCHDLSGGGADKVSLSFGVNGTKGLTNTPTVYNSALNIAQFWDGRAADLHEQVDGPVQNPLEMNTHWPEIINKLNRDQALKQQFETLYPEGLNANNIRASIVEFERSLATLNAPFDQWLLGNEAALTDKQKQGYRLFKSYGCVSCHQGANVGGNMYAYFGAVHNIMEYFELRSTPPSEADLGRYSVTKNPLDRFLFKVPSLRMASLTAPYFHDGAVPDLNTAIIIMGRFQLGREIPKEHVSAISAFISSLAGEHPELAE